MRTTSTGFAIISIVGIAVAIVAVAYQGINSVFTWLYAVSELSNEDTKIVIPQLMLVISFLLSFVLPAIIIPLLCILVPISIACLNSFLYIPLLKRRIPNLVPQNLIVVVTGCDSGFGNMAAKQLKELGYIVVGGCLTEEGVLRLKGEGLEHMIKCNVTVDKEVEDLVGLAEKLASLDPNKRVWAVVNNAGIAPMGYVDWISMKSCQDAMDVNYFGLVRVIKHILPLLKKTKNSRIINLSSLAGFSGMPGGGAYCASKHAVEGLTKSLRMELYGWNIHVTNINPGFMKTPLLTNSMTASLREFDSAPKNVTKQYSNSSIYELENLVERLKEDPQIVVDGILDCVSSANPSLNNFVGFQAKSNTFGTSFAPHAVRGAIERFFILLSGKFGPTPAAVEEYQVPMGESNYGGIGGIVGGESPRRYRSYSNDDEVSQSPSLINKRVPRDNSKYTRVVGEELEGSSNKDEFPSQSHLQSPSHRALLRGDIDITIVEVEDHAEATAQDQRQGVSVTDVEWYMSTADDIASQGRKRNTKQEEKAGEGEGTSVLLDGESRQSDGLVLSPLSGSPETLGTAEEPPHTTEIKHSNSVKMGNLEIFVDQTQSVQDKDGDINVFAARSFSTTEDPEIIKNGIYSPRKPAPVVRALDLDAEESP